jgi:hypothetical protein
LLERLLRPDLSRTPRDFRVLSRHVRLDLALLLVGKMDARTRKGFLDRLEGSTADRALQQGRKLMFPVGTEPQRQRFMRALAGGRTAPTLAPFPSVTLKFRNKDKVSPDNKCEAVTKGLVSINLGDR